MDEKPFARRGYHARPMVPVVMGVLNVTPDSFSDGGAWMSVDAAVAHTRAMLADGARIIDVGGESTRPGADPVALADEIARVVPVIEAIVSDVARAGARISIDTRRPEVASAALAAGASILNDVSASLERVAAEHGAGWIAMHMQGEPATMQVDPRYDDVVADVERFLVDAAARGRSAGVTEIWIDPGIGFGKTHEHNWELLASIDRLVSNGIPVAVGTSRKGFLGAATAVSDGTEAMADPVDRLDATVATSVWAATMGVAMVRVHDVAETVLAVQGSSVPTASSVGVQ